MKRTLALLLVYLIAFPAAIYSQNIPRYPLDGLFYAPGPGKGVETGALVGTVESSQISDELARDTEVAAAAAGKLNTNLGNAETLTTSQQEAFRTVIGAGTGGGGGLSQDAVDARVDALVQQFARDATTTIPLDKLADAIRYGVIVFEDRAPTADDYANRRVFFNGHILYRVYREPHVHDAAATFSTSNLNINQLGTGIYASRAAAQTANPSPSGGQRFYNRAENRWEIWQQAGGYYDTRQSAAAPRDAQGALWQGEWDDEDHAEANVDRTGEIVSFPDSNGTYVLHRVATFTGPSTAYIYGLEAVAGGGGGSGSGGITQAARISLSTDTTVTINSAITWNDEIFDEGDWWESANPTRLTIPAGVTKVIVFGGLQATSNTNPEFYIQKFDADGTGGPWLAHWAPSGFSLQTASTGPIEVGAGDYFELYSRGAVTLEGDSATRENTFFSIVDISGGGGGGTGGPAITGGALPDVAAAARDAIYGDGQSATMAADGLYYRKHHLRTTVKIRWENLTDQAVASSISATGFASEAESGQFTTGGSVFPSRPPGLVALVRTFNATADMYQYVLRITDDLSTSDTLYLDIRDIANDIFVDNLEVVQGVGQTDHVSSLFTLANLAFRGLTDSNNRTVVRIRTADDDVEANLIGLLDGDDALARLSDADDLNATTADAHTYADAVGERKLDTNLGNVATLTGTQQEAFRSAIGTGTGGGGTTVEANPSGTDGEDLRRLAVGGDNLKVGRVRDARGGFPTPGADCDRELAYNLGTEQFEICENSPHVQALPSGTWGFIPNRTDLLVEESRNFVSSPDLGDFVFDAGAHHFYEWTVIFQSGTTRNAWVQTIPTIALAASRSNTTYSVHFLGEQNSDNAALGHISSLAANTDYFYVAGDTIRILDLSTYVAGGTAVDHWEWRNVGDEALSNRQLGVFAEYPGLSRATEDLETIGTGRTWTDANANHARVDSFTTFPTPQEIGASLFDSTSFSYSSDSTAHVACIRLGLSETPRNFRLRLRANDNSETVYFSGSHLIEATRDLTHQFWCGPVTPFADSTLSAERSAVTHTTRYRGEVEAQRLQGQLTSGQIGTGVVPTTLLELTDFPNTYTDQGRKFIRVNVAESSLEFINEPNPPEAIPQVGAIPAATAESSNLVFLTHDYTEGVKTDVAVTLGFEGGFAGYSGPHGRPADLGSIASPGPGPLVAIIGPGTATGYTLSEVYSLNQGWLESLDAIEIGGTEYILGITLHESGFYFRRISNYPDNQTAATLDLNFRVGTNNWYWTDGATNRFTAGLYEKTLLGTALEYRKLIFDGLVHIDGVGAPTEPPTRAAQSFVNDFGQLWVAGDEIERVEMPGTVARDETLSFVYNTVDLYVFNVTGFTDITGRADGAFALAFSSDTFVQQQGPPTSSSTNDLVLSLTWEEAWTYIVNSVVDNVVTRFFRDESVYLGKYATKDDAGRALFDELDGADFAPDTYYYALSSDNIVREILEYGAGVIVREDHFFWTGPLATQTDVSNIINFNIKKDSEAGPPRFTPDFAGQIAINGIGQFFAVGSRIVTHTDPSVFSADMVITVPQRDTTWPYWKGTHSHDLASGDRGDFFWRTLENTFKLFLSSSNIQAQSWGNIVQFFRDNPTLASGAPTGLFPTTGPRPIFITGNNYGFPSDTDAANYVHAHHESVSTTSGFVWLDSSEVAPERWEMRFAPIGSFIPGETTVEEVLYWQGPAAYRITDLVDVPPFGTAGSALLVNADRSGITYGDLSLGMDDRTALDELLKRHPVDAEFEAGQGIGLFYGWNTAHGPIFGTPPTGLPDDIIGMWWDNTIQTDNYRRFVLSTNEETTGRKYVGASFRVNGLELTLEHYNHPGTHNEYRTTTTHTTANATLPTTTEAQTWTFNIEDTGEEDLDFLGGTAWWYSLTEQHIISGGGGGGTADGVADSVELTEDSGDLTITIGRTVGSNLTDTVSLPAGGTVDLSSVSGNITPDADNMHEVGTASRTFNSGRFTNFIIDDTLHVGGDVANDLVPDADGSHDLGTAARTWGGLHAVNVIADQNMRLGTQDIGDAYVGQSISGQTITFTQADTTTETLMLPGVAGGTVITEAPVSGDGTAGDPVTIADDAISGDKLDAELRANIVSRNFPLEYAVNPTTTTGDAERTQIIGNIYQAETDLVVHQYTMRSTLETGHSRNYTPRAFKVDMISATDYQRGSNPFATVRVSALGHAYAANTGILTDIRTDLHAQIYDGGLHVEKDEYFFLGFSHEAGNFETYLAVAFGADENTHVGSATFPHATISYVAKGANAVQQPGGTDNVYNDNTFAMRMMIDYEVAGGIMTASDEGTLAFTGHAEINCTGAGITCSEDTTNDRLTINVPGGGGGTFSGARAEVSTDYIITGQSSFTSIIFNEASVDEGGWWDSTNPTRLTVPAGVSHVMVQAGIDENTNTGSAARLLQIVRTRGTTNTVFAYSHDIVTTRGRFSATTGIVPVEAGDYFTSRYLCQTCNPTIAGDLDATFLSIVDMSGGGGGGGATLTDADLDIATPANEPTTEGASRQAIAEAIADQPTIVGLTQTAYDTLTPDTNTLYIITP